MILFPRNHVYAIFMFITIISIPAAIGIRIWIIFRIIMGLNTVLGVQSESGVAYGAYIGGLFAGVVLATVMRKLIKEERPCVFTRHLESAKRYW